MSNSILSEEQEDEKINLNILILGDSSVGKEELISKYVDDGIPRDNFTIGREVKYKKININGIDLNLTLWDTAGQERFSKISTSCLEGADGFIYIWYTDKSTYEKCINWILQVEESKENFKKILVGNNCDLENERKVFKERVQSFCERQKLQEIEISTKNGTNINECFELLVKLIIEGKTKEELIEKYCCKNKK